MDNSFVNITSEVPLSMLSPVEVDATLCCILSCSTILPEEPDTTIYGNVVKVLHKTNGARILKITADRQYWEGNKSHFLEVMNRAANPSEVKIISRIVFSLGGDLNIYPFRWKDEFQLGRVPDGSPKPEELYALYPCLFQFAVPHANLPWLDAHRVESVFKTRFLPLLPLLRQYCTTSLQYYPLSCARKSWVLDFTAGKITPRWLQEGYFPDWLVEESSYFNYSDPATKHLPIDSTDPYWLASVHLSHGYRLYESLCPKDREKFLLGCEWLHKALIADDSTDQVLFLMIMLEIFLPPDSARCDDCGQPKYAISKKFRTFIPEVVGKDWSSNFTNELNRLYSLRSRIAHTGIALAKRSVGLVPIGIKEDNQKNYLFQLARQFLVSWLFYRHSGN